MHGNSKTGIVELTSKNLLSVDAVILPDIRLPYFLYTHRNHVVTHKVTRNGYPNQTIAGIAPSLPKHMQSRSYVLVGILVP